MADESGGGSTVEVDEELIEDFFWELNEAYTSVKNDLVQLESAPDDKALINALFRTVHSIKSNLRMVGFEQVSSFVHILENILEDIRNDELAYNIGLSDVVLLSVQHIKVLCHAFFEGLPVDDLAALEAALQSICDCNEQTYQSCIADVVHLLSPDAEVVESLSGVVSESGVNGLEVSPSKSKQEEDLAYFLETALLLDAKVPYWQGRTQRILKLAQVMNQLSGNVVESIQLEAAVYLHDIGMAFLPDGLTGIADEFTEDDLVQVKTHPVLGYRWISRIEGWEEAAIMVKQHHERVDGKGYPDALPKADIYDGAQILAIADTFEAMTQERAVRAHKRPFMRAILEINNCAGEQFDDKWVAIFNQVARKLQK
ncbi:MAG: HD domain-containing protein [Methylococcales bacterium]|nr:HD domain-containing protein [Methylococcales bacterium]MBT7442573.1 HD domain-containing protein [Methylococcales bacterium]